MGELVLLPCERSSIVPGTFQWLLRGPRSKPLPHFMHSFSLTNPHILCIPHPPTHTPSHSLSLLCHTLIPLGHSLVPPSFFPTFSSFLTSRQGPSLPPAHPSPLPPSRSLFRLIDVIVVPARQ